MAKTIRRIDFDYTAWKAEQTTRRAGRVLELRNALANGSVIWHGGTVWSTAGVIRVPGRFGRTTVEAGAAFIEPYQSDPDYLANHIENREYGLGMETAIVSVADATEQLIDAATRHISTNDETFIECLECGEVDSHTDTCSIPGLLKYLSE